MRRATSLGLGAVFINLQKPMGDLVCNRILADEEGFEPSYGFSHNTLSKRAPSATRPPIRGIKSIKKRIYQSSLKLEQTPALVYQGTPQCGDADHSARKKLYRKSTGSPKDSSVYPVNRKIPISNFDFLAKIKKKSYFHSKAPRFHS